jgi:hypothetical protein
MNLKSLAPHGRAPAVAGVALLLAGAGSFSPSAHAQQSGDMATLTTDLDAPDGTVNGSTTNPALKKVVNGQFAVQVDNGFVVYQGFQNSPTLDIYSTKNNVTAKLKTGLFGTSQGNFFSAGGIVYGACPTTLSKNCVASDTSGQTGTGVGFGEVIVQGGGQGSSVGGWTNDETVLAHITDNTAAPGSINAVAIDPANGAYAVGWHDNATTTTQHGIIVKLDSLHQTYAPVSETDLGTLGGSLSEALGISPHASLVVGSAATAAGVNHAVYAAPTATGWTDAAANFPTTAVTTFGSFKILKSQATVANDSGVIAGQATVKESNVGGHKSISIAIGFVYNTQTQSVAFYGVPGANVIPLKVLANGDVVGNLSYVAPPKSTALPAYHPFLYAGSTLTDFGTMTLSGGAAYGCRVNRPNNLGEVVGTCIATSAGPYGETGTAFYLNTLAATPAFENLHAVVHAREDGPAPSALAPYNLGTASSIDDQHELTMIGIRFQGGVANRAAYLIEPSAYQ